jgi:hypothetical protein
MSSLFWLLQHPLLQIQSMVPYIYEFCNNTYIEFTTSINQHVVVKWPELFSSKTSGIDSLGSAQKFHPFETRDSVFSS